MTKFTKEFIEEQRALIDPAAAYTAEPGFAEYAVAACNNYPDALDEIERLNEIVADRTNDVIHQHSEIKQLQKEVRWLNDVIVCIKHTLKSDSEKYSWEVAGVNTLRLIELNMEGGEE